MVIEKIVIRNKKQRVHTHYKNNEDGMHAAYQNEHVNTHRRVNKQVIACLEEIGEL